MVAGTSSWAGKSVLATGLCASLRRRGVRVAPFKAQNMSNNARVVEGGEIGAAQYFQALAAGVTPSVDHNPILLKPEADIRSQVVVLGKVDRVLTEMPWRERAPYLWEIVRDAYDRVAGDTDIVVLEGAGSPAEVNLAGVDLANLRIGRHANAPMLVVCDIDRGGAFAHLYGTWALLDPIDRRRVAGFVLNRFRGDPTLLAPGPAILEQKTGVPTLGVVPMVDHGLPDEDGAAPAPSGGSGQRVRIVRGPAASNLDEWWQLREASDCRWATRPADLSDAELVVLPGSKLPAVDVAWMRATGVDAAILSAHRRGVRILAVCGEPRSSARSWRIPTASRVAGRRGAWVCCLPPRRWGQPSEWVGPPVSSELISRRHGLTCRAFAWRATRSTSGRRAAGRLWPRRSPTGRGWWAVPSWPCICTDWRRIRRCSWRSSAGSCRALFPRCSTAWPTWSTGTWTWTRCCT